jgi:multimeric flavodoxin WrbA
MGSPGPLTGDPVLIDGRADQEARERRPMGKRIVVLLGSPRKMGNSSRLAEHLSRGASSRGASVEAYYLNGMDIRPCQACMKCQKEGSPGCAVRDDMQDLYPRLKEADVVVMASPIYWFNMSAQTKTVIDRFYAVGVGERNVFKGKPFVFLLSYADADPFVSGAVNALRSFGDMCNYLEAEIAGMLYGSAGDPGEIEKNQALMDEAYQLGCRLAG